MSQCLRCSKPCEVNSVFCEACKLHLRNQLWQTAHTREEESLQIPPFIAIAAENGEVSGDPLERITGPQPVVNVPYLPQTSLPSPPIMAVSPHRGDIAEHAVHNLNEAALQIAHVEQGSRRTPRASRLSPLQDISADIQRHSTPLPQITKKPEREPSQDLGKRMPDLWPWLQDVDGDENESDQWSNRTDPLQGRRFPNSAEVAQIEAEDVRRAVADGLVTIPLLPKRVSTSRLRRRMQIAFVILAILAVVAVVMDGGLVLLALVHPHHSKDVLNGPPSLTLSANTAHIGQTIGLHIQQFSSNTQVYLTHDIQETVQLTSGTALVKVGANGSANETMLVDLSWTPGFHTIEAEDVTTRYTASATLQIIGAGPTPPSHLLIPPGTMDLGPDYQGANTIRPLQLKNSGGGSISWTASSDQPWLLISPAQGVFSGSQKINIAVERANLRPRPQEYKGTITFSSNIGSPQWVQVQMSVRPLPSNPGPVLELTPPVFSFTAQDGGSNPPNQVLTVNNPGSQPLNWSITSNNQIPTTQSFLLFAFNPQSSWLSTDQSAGLVVPHGSKPIYLIVNSRNLLPGTYTDVLVFTSSHGINSPQSVYISLTVQPRCGLTLNTGSLSFITVAGQNNPSNQALTVGATTSCSGVINWKAVSANNWLTLTPASGQLKPATTMVASVGVNTATLKPGTYPSTISFISGQSTQTVVVQLVVQNMPAPSAPIMGATPLNLNFSTTQGMPSPPGQVVTITNTGHSQLNWRTQVNTLAASWLGAGPTGGPIAAGQTGQVTVLINTTGLTPNTYVGQVTLIGTDTNGNTASGSPQVITINLLVLPPCLLQQPSLSSVAFNATQGTINPGSQAVSIVASGNCAWPLNWQATPTSSAPWLQITPTTGIFAASGQSVSINLTANIAGLGVGTYMTQVTINASDGSNTPVQGNPQSFTVTLTILPPCVLSLNSTNLTFSVGQGQPAPGGQNFSLSESGTCALPVTWLAVGDAGSSGWLVIGPPATGTGNATVGVGVNSQGLAPGTYSGKITVSASGNGGATVLNSPQIVNISLVVTGYNLSGKVIACPTIGCLLGKRLPGSTLTLLNNATNQSITITADSLGNYLFAGLSMGAYTLSVTGSDGLLNYSRTVTLTISGNQTNFTVDVYPL